jgi:hypothetical protein
MCCVTLQLSPALWQMAGSRAPESVPRLCIALLDHRITRREYSSPLVCLVRTVLAIAVPTDIVP